MKVYRSFLILVLILSVFLLPEIGGVANTQGNKLVIGTTDRVNELSPANSYDHYSWHVLHMCSDALLKYRPGTNQVAPAIAKDWEVGPDAQVYTFYLREGITFTDGESVDAQAVKWSLERALRLSGAQGGVHLISMIENITVVDELTVEITLEASNSTFLKRMTGSVAPALIWSPASTPEDEFARGTFAGVGPYKLENFTPDQAVEYRVYQNYYGKVPEIETIIEKKYDTSAGLKSALELGDIDVAFRTLTPSDILDLKNVSGLESNQPETSTITRYLLFNVSSEKFGNEKVRQAISYGVGRSAIVNGVFSGMAAPMYSMVPKSFAASKATFPKRDVEKAETKLRNAGYTASSPLEAALWFTPRHYGSSENDVAETIKESLNEVENLQITTESLEWGNYVKKMSAGDLGIFLLGWYPDYLSACNFLRPFTVGSPEALGTFFNEDEDYSTYKSIFKEAMSTPDPAKRSSLYVDIQEKSAEDVMFVPLWSNLAQAFVFYDEKLDKISVGPNIDIRPWSMAFNSSYVISRWNTEKDKLNPDLSCKISTNQILQAIAWWADGTPIPNTREKKLTTDRILDLIAKWADGTCASGARSSS